MYPRRKQPDRPPARRYTLRAIMLSPSWKGDTFRHELSSFKSYSPRQEGRNNQNTHLFPDHFSRLVPPHSGFDDVDDGFLPPPARSSKRQEWFPVSVLGAACAAMMVETYTVLPPLYIVLWQFTREGRVVNVNARSQKASSRCLRFVETFTAHNRVPRWSSSL